MVFDFQQFKVLTFDCYGTLIDWEKGILTALRSVLTAVEKYIPDEEILTRYAGIEPKLQSKTYLNYRETLRRVMDQLAIELGFEPGDAERDCLANSIGSWPPFPDTVTSLRKLKKKHRLAIISNIDDDLFEQTAKHLEVPFDWIITAEQARAYKPSHKIFKFAFERIGVPKNEILHVAQSIYHDIIPAAELGISTVWINRRKSKQGTGATPPAECRPDLEVPDLMALVSKMDFYQNP